MTLQFIGPILALTTLVTIGAGHIFVRRLNYLYGTKPCPIVFAVGIVFLLVSLRVTNDVASAVMGIIGVTTLWDGYELIRQEERVRRGRAPSNPRRPVEPRRR